MNCLQKHLKRSKYHFQTQYNWPSTHRTWPQNHDAKPTVRNLNPDRLVPDCEAAVGLSSIGWADSCSSESWFWDSEACQESRLWAQAFLLILAGGASHSSMSLAWTGRYSGGRFTCRDAKWGGLLVSSTTTTPPEMKQCCLVSWKAASDQACNKSLAQTHQHTSLAYLRTSRGEMHEQVFNASPAGEVTSVDGKQKVWWTRCQVSISCIKLSPSYL